jgi:hypothetical protein
MRILNEEAKREDCELTDQNRITSYSVLENVFKILESDKIGVKLLENKAFEPQYTACGIVFWIPTKKQSSKKQPAK